MNRVTALGPIDLPSKYFKPPEPPIFIAVDGSDHDRMELVCKACLPPVSFAPIKPGAVAAPSLIEKVSMNRDAFRYGHERECVAYIGQCERCQRIYIATADDAFTAHPPPQR